MSGGTGVAQFKKCRCGGLLNDGWDACKFCGAEVEDDLAEGVAGAADPGQGAKADPQKDGNAVPSSDRGPQTRTIGVVAAGAVLLIGVLGFVALGGGSDDPPAAAAGLGDTTSAQEPTDEQTRILGSYQNFCAGDRAGIAEAAAFDLTETDRAIFIANGTPGAQARDSRLTSETGGYASLIICIDVVGDVTYSELCEGYETGAVYLGRQAPMRLTSFDARTGATITQTDAPPYTGCPDAAAIEPDSGGVDIGDPMPNSSVYDAFVRTLTNPAS